MNQPKEATEKAKDLVRMAIAKAALLDPLVASIFRSVMNNEQYAKWEAMNAEYEKAHSVKKL